MWYYRGIEFNYELIPDKAIGFIYSITHLPTSRVYIGRKLLTKAHRYQKNKVVYKTRVESNWKEYWSSSPDLLRMLEEEGEENFRREILIFANTKGQLNYLEERILYSVGAMETAFFINSNIRSKMYKRNIINKLDIVELDSAIDKLKVEIKNEKITAP
jgi:hypothetical protein